MERLHDLDDHPETMWRIKRAGSTGDANESDSRELPGVDLAESHLTEDSRGRSKRSSFANETSRGLQMTGNVSENAIGARSSPAENSSSRQMNRRSEPKVTPRDIAVAGDSEPLDLAKSQASSNVSVNSGSSTRLSISDFRAAAGNRSGGETEHKVTARQVSRLARVGPSKRGGEELPQGNMSRCLGSTNESRAGVVETTAVAAAGGRETAGGAREPILLGVIKVFVSEPQGRPNQKREADAVVRLSRRTEEEEEGVFSLSSAEKMGTSGVNELRDAGGCSADASSIDVAGVATAGLEVANASGCRRDDDDDNNYSAPAVLGDDSREQQMVPSLDALNGRQNERDSDADGADTPGGSSGNETMNVKKGVETVIESDNSRRRLLWIATSSVDKDRQRAKKVTDAAEPSRGSLKVDREDRAPRSDLNTRVSSHVRRKRSTCSLEKPDDEVVEGDVAIGKAAVRSRDDKREDNEEYLNQEELVADYNDREEGAGTIRRS